MHPGVALKWAMPSAMEADAFLLTRAPVERGRRGVAERRHVFLTEHVRLPISKGQLDESEYDGRRPGSYAMNPLRGARAAALASGVNMHVGASRRDMSFPSDLEPEWRCLGGDNGRQKWVDDRSRLVQLST